MIIGSMEKERLERKHLPPLCFDHKNEPVIPPVGDIAWDFEPQFNNDTVQLLLTPMFQ